MEILNYTGGKTFKRTFKKFNQKLNRKLENLRFGNILNMKTKLLELEGEFINKKTALKNEFKICRTTEGRQAILKLLNLITIRYEKERQEMEALLEDFQKIKIKK